MNNLGYTPNLSQVYQYNHMNSVPNFNFMDIQMNNNGTFDNGMVQKNQKIDDEEVGPTKKKGLAPVNKSKKNKNNSKSKTEKNREAAKQFRQRQRDYLSELEQQFTILNEKHAKYSAQAELLKSENDVIKQQQQFLRKFIEQALVNAYPIMMQRMQAMMNNDQFMNNGKSQPQQQQDKQQDV